MDFNKQPSHCRESSALSLQDRIFLGEGLFETIRFVNKTLCHVQLHWERLLRGVVVLGLNFSLSFEEWFSQLSQVIANQPIQSGGVKVILTGGAAIRGLTQKGESPQLFFDVFSYEINQKPLRLISAPWFRDANNPVYSVKSVNYLEAILARRYAQSNQVDDVLFFNLQQHVLETAVANLFAVVDDVLCTPGVDEGVLPGVTRRRIIAFCVEQRIPIQECPIDQSMLARASSVFVCNALQGIQTVLAWDEVNYPLKGAILQKLLSHVDF